MSQETSAWLNENIMVGFDQRPWWANDDVANHDNLYSGPLDRNEVRRKLLGFTPDREDIFDKNGEKIDDYVRLVPSDNPRATLGIHGSDYVVHEYKELMSACALDVVSAGLLKSRRQFWVQFGTGELQHTRAGVDFLPYIMLSTSLDGSMSTQANDGSTLAVCDNTMQFGRMEGEKFKIKHSSKSGTHWLSDTKQAVAQLMKIEQETAESIDQLASIDVSESQFSKWLDIWKPLPEIKKSKGGGNGVGWTKANNAREFMDELYHTDSRVAPWTGTGFGVVQAANTYKNHNAIVSGAHRAERNLSAAATGKMAQHTTETIKQLEMALA